MADLLFAAIDLCAGEYWYFSRQLGRSCRAGRYFRLGAAAQGSDLSAHR